MPWWRRWLRWWPSYGELSLRDGQILRIDVRDGPPRVVDFNQPFVTHLTYWPKDQRQGWLAVVLRQKLQAITFITALPWSAIPTEAKALQQRAGRLREGHFKGLWPLVMDASQAHGHRLPQITRGLYPDAPRGTELLHISAPAQYNPPIRVGPYPTPTSRNRQEIKTFVRGFKGDERLTCPFCRVTVKAHNMVRHCDRHHHEQMGAYDHPGKVY